MKDNKINRIIIGVIVFCIILICIIIFTPRNNLKIFNQKSIDDIIALQRESNKKGILSLNYLNKNYNLNSSTVEEGITTNIYDLNDKYILQAKGINGYVLSLYLINKITYSSIDVINGDLEEFFKYD